MSNTLILVGVVLLVILVLASSRRKKPDAKPGASDNSHIESPAGEEMDADKLRVRVKLPTGEKGTVEKLFSDGKAYVRFDPKPGEPDKRMYAGSPEKTHALAELLQVPPQDRDAQWNKAFFDNVADANLRGDFEQPIIGPDSFPYFRLSSPEPNKLYKAWVIRHILPNLLEHGYGVAINLEKGEPDWVFSYGDIVNYAVYGAFDARDDQFEAYDDSAQSEEIPEGETVQIGAPSPQLLPPPVRAMLRRFLEAHDFPAKAMLMNRGANPQAGRKGGLSLVFPIPQNIEPDSEMAQYVFRALPWFLPRHYTVVWMREDERFTEL